MRRFRPFLTALLTFCALWACTATALAADSGSSTLPKLSKVEIIDLLQNFPLSEPTHYYEEEPSLTAPHTTGKVRQEILDSGLNRVNVVRRLAGLPPVVLNETYTEIAQAGSVLMASSGQFSHHPSQPVDMSDAFYALGYQGTSSSNISYRLSSSTMSDPIPSSIDGCMSDSSISNISRVGHRRWLLDPWLSDIGFGVAHAVRPGAYYDYTELYMSTYVWGGHGPYIPYHFIAWPASGLFPNTLFAGNDPWSVSLSTKQYYVPSEQDRITVTLSKVTEAGVERTWIFHTDESYSPSASDPFFTISGLGYGDGPAIIFRPDGIAEYNGTYTVSIEGLYQRITKRPITLEYRVEFFTPTCLDGHSYKAHTADPTCTLPGSQAHVCSVCGKEESPVELPALGHNYQRSVVKVSCETPGSVTDTCSRCGDTVLVEETPALGHDWAAAPICIDETLHAVLCQREGCGAEKDMEAHSMSFMVDDDHLPYSVCSGCEYRLASLRVSETETTVTVALDYVPQPLRVVAARYDSARRLLCADIRQFTQADTHTFFLPVGSLTRVFFLNEPFTPFYAPK